MGVGGGGGRGGGCSLQNWISQEHMLLEHDRKKIFFQIFSWERLLSLLLYSYARYNLLINRNQITI